MRLLVAVLTIVAFGHPARSEDNKEANQLLMAAPSVTVTTEDFDRYVDMMVPEDRRESALARPDAVKQSIESIYLVRYFANLAKENPNLVDIEQAQWEARHYGDRTLMTEYLDAVVERDLAEERFGKVAEEEYLANKERYVTQETRKAAHVLVDTASRTDKEALARILEARAELEAGADFADVARRYSDDGSAEQNGGDLGTFSRGRMVKPFEDVAFELEVGVLSEPVKTRFGYHLILVEEITPARQLEFIEVEKDIRRQIRGNRRQALRQRYIEEAKTSATENGLVVNAETVRALEQKYAPQSAPDGDS